MDLVRRTVERISGGSPRPLSARRQGRFRHDAFLNWGFGRLRAGTLIVILLYTRIGPGLGKASEFEP
jgi:hypothetical protein